MHNSVNRGCFDGRSTNKPCRKSGRRPAAFRVLRPCKPHFSLWESNPEFSDTSMDHMIVAQDLLNAVAALESGEESDVRRQLSTLAVLSGGESDCRRKTGFPLRRKILRHKARNLKKKRRPKRKFVSVHPPGDNATNYDAAAAIARPRHESHLSVPNSGRAGSIVGHTSSEDDGSAALRQLQLFMSDDNSSSAAGLRRGDSEVSSSVCVTESELSDTAWEESCDADDELSCFEAPSSSSAGMRSSSLRMLEATRAVSRHCYGDVEDAYEVDTGASDHDGRNSLMASSDIDSSLTVMPLPNPVVSVSAPDAAHTVGVSPTSLVRPVLSPSARSAGASTRTKELSKLTSSTSSIGGNDRPSAQPPSARSRPSSASASAMRHGTDAFPFASASIVSSLRTLNRVLFQFVTSRKRTLQLPTMHRRSRRVVWQLASLYRLEWSVESSSGRSRYSVLTCTKKSSVPDASVVEQFIKEAAQLLSKPVHASGILEWLPFSAGSPSLSLAHRRSLCLNIQEPAGSEEMEADETSATDAGDVMQH
eukprot:scpid43280/ scgid33295/ 